MGIADAGNGIMRIASPYRSLSWVSLVWVSIMGIASVGKYYRYS